MLNRRGSMITTVIWSEILVKTISYCGYVWDKEKVQHANNRHYAIICFFFFFTIESKNVILVYRDIQIIFLDVDLRRQHF